MKNNDSSNALAQIGDVGGEPVHATRRAGPSSMEVAEIESQIATAKRYPRNISRFTEELATMATRDEETAAACYYAIPRDGKTIEGPSVRLAEIAFVTYGNCVAEAHVADNDGKFVTAVGTCRDLERNVAMRSESKRRITDKRGRTYSDDMVATTANAACAIARRNAILATIPRAFVDPVFKKCRAIAAGKAEGLAKKRTEVLRRLAKMGANEARVLQRLERNSVEDITTDDVATLIGLGVAVHDGEVDLDTAFPAVTAAASRSTRLDAEPVPAVGDESNGPFPDPDPDATPDAEFERKRRAVAESLADGGDATPAPGTSASKGKRSNLF